MRRHLVGQRRIGRDCKPGQPRPAGRLARYTDGEDIMKGAWSMGAAAKKYNTLYKKNHVERDMYLPRLDPKGVIHRSGCGAFHHRRHWTLTPPVNLAAKYTAISFSVPRAGRFRIGFRAVSSLCVALKRETEERLPGSYATKRRGRGRKIRWSGLCAWMQRMAAGGSRPRPRSWRSGWDARLRRQGVESSVTSWGIIISLSVWCGKSAEPAGWKRMKDASNLIRRRFQMLDPIQGVPLHGKKGDREKMMGYMA